MNYGEKTRMKLELREQKSEKKIARKKLERSAAELWFRLGFGTLCLVFGTVNVKMGDMGDISLPIWPWGDISGNAVPGQILTGLILAFFLFSAFLFLMALRSYSARRALREMDRPDRTIVPENWSGHWPG